MSLGPKQEDKASRSAQSAISSRQRALAGCRSRLRAVVRSRPSDSDRPFSSEVDTGCGSGMASVGRYLREGDRPMRRQLDRIDDDHACGAGR